MKKKRAWWFIGGFALVVLLFTFIFMSLREHRDYKRAAERLPEARRRAEELIGPMTWEAYRKERGVEESDDFDEWIALKQTIPPIFGDYDNSRNEKPYTVNLEKLFHGGRDWLFSLALTIEPLRLTRSTDHAEAIYSGEDLMASSSLARLVTQLLVGAADAGDVEAIREVGKVMTLILERQVEEYDTSSWLSSSSSCERLTTAIVYAAVRNRHNLSVMQALRQLMADLPKMQPFWQALIGDARTYAPVFRELHAMRPADIEIWLDETLEIGVDYADYGDVSRWFRSAVENLGGQPGSNRRVGSHTAPALEARYWEVLVECVSKAKDLSYTAGDSHVRLRDLSDLLYLFTDRSYEFAALAAWVESADYAANHYLASFDASAIALELILRYQNLEDLPAALPADLVAPDAFGGEPLLYRKTPYGFLIYTRYKDRIDDGYIPVYPDSYEVEARTSPSLDEKDWGLIVGYDIPDPLP